ncbi:MAG: ferric reductase-like transmembrane domain-containing protein [Candidatus Peribacteraceae bacterium]
MSLQTLLNVRNTRWLFGAVVTVWWIFIFVGSGGTAMNWSEAIRGTGNLTWILLIFVIFISLLHKLFSRVRLFDLLLPLRKHAGVFAFLVLCSHAAGQFIRSGVFGDPAALLAMAFSTRYAMVFGSVAFLILLPVFLTSTVWAVRTMGYRSWKNVQRITHVAFVFAALHVGLISYFYRGTIEPGPFVVLGLYVAGYAWLFIMRRRAQT